MGPIEKCASSCWGFPQHSPEKTGNRKLQDQINTNKTRFSKNSRNLYQENFNNSQIKHHVFVFGTWFKDARKTLWNRVHFTIHKEENENRFLKMLLLWSIRVIIKIYCLVHCHVFSCCGVIYSTKIFTVKIKRLLWWEFCEKKVSGMMSLLYEINFSCPLKVYPW